MDSTKKQKNRIVVIKKRHFLKRNLLGLYFLLGVLLCIHTFADTFTHRETGEKFDGYPTMITRGSKTQVRSTKNKGIRYLNLSDYSIERNHLGRKNEVRIFNIEGPIELICEKEAFIQGITAAANQGPLLILIKIDTDRGRLDLAKEMAESVKQITCCDTLAYVAGGKYGGVHSSGTAVALACDRIFMRDGTTIGLGRPYVASLSNINPFTMNLPLCPCDKTELNQWQNYCSSLIGDAKSRIYLAQLNPDKAFHKDSVNDAREDIYTVNIPSIDYRGVFEDENIKMTADKATNLGISKGHVLSETILINELGIDNARCINDRRMNKARMNYNRIKSRLEKLLSEIEYREEANFGMVNRVINSPEIGPSFKTRLLEYQGWFTHRWGERSIIRYRETYVINLYEYFQQWLEMLNKLERDYSAALLYAEKYPDFGHMQEDLRRGEIFVKEHKKDVIRWLKLFKRIPKRRTVTIVRK